MTTPTEYGATSEVWFAKLAAPSTKWSFLTRDDAGSKSGVTYGRTIRLGDPITVGPNSVWQQTSWEGGLDQEHWRDTSMYRTGSVDAYSNLGRLQLPSGFKQILATKNRGITEHVFGTGAGGYGADTKLWIGEMNNEPLRTDPTTGTAVPPTGFRLHYYDPATDTVTTYTTAFEGSITNIVRLSDAQNPDRFITAWYLHQSDSSMHIYTVDEAAALAGADIGATGTGVTLQNSVVIYGDSNYFPLDDALYKRTYDGSNVYTLVKRFPAASYLRALTVWNNRIWFGAVQSGGNTTICTSDGTTAVTAFNMPASFMVRGLVGLGNNLYVYGFTKSSRATEGYIGQVWKYNGSSLSLLWSRGTGFDGRDYGVYGACQWGKYLAWGVNSTTSGELPGVYLYDPDLDSIHAGPCLDTDPTGGPVQVRSVSGYNNRLAISVWDQHNYSSNVNNPTGVWLSSLDGTVRNRSISAGYEGHSLELQPSTQERFLLSSVYEGEPGTEYEQKVWLVGRVSVRLATTGAQLLVKAVLDEGTAYTVATIDYDGSALGWRDVTFSLKNGSSYLSGRKIQYQLFFRNTASGTPLSTATPEIDNVYFEYSIKAKKRRQWIVRIPVSDAQLALSGSANSLTTSAAMRDKLEELWSDQLPLLFWTQETTGASSGSGIEVFPTAYNEQMFRLESDAQTVDGECSLTLVEVVNI